MFLHVASIFLYTMAKDFHFESIKFPQGMFKKCPWMHLEILNWIFNNDFFFSEWPFSPRWNKTCFTMYTDILTCFNTHIYMVFYWCSGVDTHISCIVPWIGFPLVYFSLNRWIWHPDMSGNCTQWWPKLFGSCWVSPWYHHQFSQIV